MKAKELYSKIEKSIVDLYTKISDIIKIFLSKDKFVFIKLFILFIVACAFSVLYEYKYCIHRYGYDSKVRMIIVAGITFYVGLHFIFSLSKMYNFIHKNRYFIACAFLVFVMIFKLSGSSIVEYNSLIQSHHGDDRKFNTLLGRSRMIRTDEWATSTTYILSQANSQTPFSYFSDVLRGTSTDMFTVSNGPVLDILLLGRPFQIGFILFGNSMGLSFYWYIRLLAMMLGSYELCLILTKKNKRASLLGMIMITFSSATQWWYCMDSLIWGQIALVMFYHFMNTKKKWAKYLTAFGILVSGLSYIFVFYPAWQLPFGYVFLGIVIWMLIDSIKYGDYKINKHDVLVACITLLCLIAVLSRWYILSKDTLAAEMNTDYPGERQELGGHARNIFSYFYNIFFPFRDYLNPCEYAQMLSFFPVPLILGIVYAFRNKRNLHFWVPMLIINIFLTVWCTVGFPAFLANITKMSMAQAGRATIPHGVSCIYLLIFLIGNYDDQRDKLLNRYVATFLAFICTVYVAYRAKHTIEFADVFLYLDDVKMILGFEIFFAANLCLFNLAHPKLRKIGGALVIIIALMSGLTVNPVISSTNIFYEKPVAKKMNEIRESDPNAIWAVNDDGWYCNDYPLASGIRTINSTQLYPNFEMYEKLFGKEKLEDVEFRVKVNRYCHINFVIVDEPSDVDLIYPDNIALLVNYKDLPKLNVKYIISFDDLSVESFGEYFKELYNEDGTYIYEFDPAGLAQ